MSGNQTEDFFRRVEHPVTPATDTAPSDYRPVAVATPVTFCGEPATAGDAAELASAELTPEVQERVNQTYGK